MLESVRVGESVGRFLIGQAPFVALGLELAAFGVALAASTYTAAEVNAVAAWCLLGAGAMGAVPEAAYARAAQFAGDAALAGAGELTADVLIAGGAGGVLIGLRSAANRRHRRGIARQDDRLTVINRLLRYEVPNRLNAVVGYAEAHVDDGEERFAAAVWR